MASQKNLDYVYMTCAEAHATLSRAQRKSVGACIVTRNGAILGGTNGMAPSGSNELEYVDEDTGELVTKRETIHGELNCILKAAKEGVSVVGSTLYVTLSPCLPCSEMVAAAGIRRVVYKEDYRDLSGIQNLKSLGVILEKYEEND